MSEGNAKRHAIRLLRRLLIGLICSNKRNIERLFINHQFERGYGSLHMKASRAIHSARRMMQD